jgi:biopolymer transport protein ExbD
MKLRNLRVENQPQLMIIPMIDIIFFLLVFFMMSTLYMVEQHTLPVNLPQAAAQQDTTKSVTVTVQANGSVLFNQEEIPLSLLSKRVTLELGKQSNSLFVLRGDKQVAYGQIIAVLDALKQAGAHRVSVAVEKAR